MWNIKKQKIRLIISAVLLLIVGVAQAGFSSHPFASIILGSSILLTLPDVEWERTFGSEYDDIGHAVQQTCDGGYIVTGMIGSDDGGPGDIYLFKTDASGNLVWEKRFGRVGIPGDDDAGRSVQQTTDGGYIVVGWTGVGIDNEDAYFLKTDASGNIEWDNRFGGAACEQFFSVQQTKDGGYIAAGWTREFGHGLEDVYLVKTDGSGNMTLEKAFGGTGRDYGYSVQQTPDGGYVVAGVSYLLAYHISDAYLIKTDSSGNLLWERKYGGSDTFEYAFSVDQTSDGGYILAGMYGIYLIKTDPSGNILWERTFNGNDAQSVQQTRDGGYIVAGHGGGGACLIKTDASGNLVWEKIWGNSNTFVQCVQQTRDGGYILTGRTWGAESDVYLAKLGPDVSGGPHTFYVDDDAANDPGPGDPAVSDPLEDGTQDHPFDAIQEAIDTAWYGDTIIVLDGTYTGKGNLDINFKGKAITIRSQNGPESCVINADGTEAHPHRGFYFHSNENACSVLDGFTITNGYAYSGGAIYCGGRSSPTLVNCIITGSIAEYEGGGIYNDAGSPTLTNCTFTNNTAAQDGGGMQNDNGNPVLTNCAFSNNSATDEGGGMCNEDNRKPPLNPILNNCTFSNNSAGNYGGGICNHKSNPTLTNCTFTGNSAAQGAGMYNNKSNPTVTNCTFFGNSVYWKDKGGGMYNYFSNPTIKNCTFHYNWAENAGGAIACIENSSPIISHCNIIGNRVYFDGAGIYCQTSSSPIIKNCLIVNNFANEGDGGAIVCVQESSPAIINCTLANNIGGCADEVGSDDTSIPVIKNSILAESVYVDGSSVVTYRSNCPGDPCFADPLWWGWDGIPVLGDYHLKSQSGRWDANSSSWVKDDVTSPCIDAGDPASPIGLEPFPNGGIINMGTYGGTEQASKSYFGKPPCETIMAGDLNGDCVVNFKDFAIMAFHWLEEH